MSPACRLADGSTVSARGRDRRDLRGRRARARRGDDAHRPRGPRVARRDVRGTPGDQTRAALDAVGASRRSPATRAAAWRATSSRSSRRTPWFRWGRATGSSCRLRLPAVPLERGRPHPVHRARRLRSRLLGARPPVPRRRRGVEPAGRWLGLEPNLPGGKCDANSLGPVSLSVLDGSAPALGDARMPRAARRSRGRTRRTRGRSCGSSPPIREVPRGIRDEVARWGFAPDEFVDTGHVPHQALRARGAAAARARSCSPNTTCAADSCRRHDRARLVPPRHPRGAALVDLGLGAPGPRGARRVGGLPLRRPPAYRASCTARCWRRAEGGQPARRGVRLVRRTSRSRRSGWSRSTRCSARRRTPRRRLAVRSGSLRARRRRRALSADSSPPTARSSFLPPASGG